MTHSNILLLSIKSNNDRNLEPGLLQSLQPPNHTQTDNTHKLCVTCLALSPCRTMLSRMTQVWGLTWKLPKGSESVQKKEMVIFWPHWIVKIKVRKKWRGGNLQTQNAVFIVKVSVFWLCKCSFVILWLFYDFQTLSLCRGLADLVKRFSIIPVPVSGCCYIT